jgi:type III secretory pathway component EscU
MTTSHSPAATTIYKAWLGAHPRQQISAVLRAAADQVVPVLSDMEVARSNYPTVYEHCRVRHQLLSPAAELDAQINSTEKTDD